MLESSFKSNSKHNRLFFPGNFDQMQNVYLYGNMSRFRCHFEIDLIIFTSMLPVDGQGGTNRKALVRMTIMLSALVSVTCLLNVFCTTLIFAESKETIYGRIEIN